LEWLGALYFSYMTTAVAGKKKSFGIIID